MIVFALNIVAVQVDARVISSGPRFSSTSKSHVALSPAAREAADIRAFARRVEHFIEFRVEYVDPYRHFLGCGDRIEGNGDSRLLSRREPPCLPVDATYRRLRNAYRATGRPSSWIAAVSRRRTTWSVGPSAMTVPSPAECRVGKTRPLPEGCGRRR
jgi:hypothetical protein